MKNVIVYIILAIVSFAGNQVLAQDGKERGDTDYTNNRSKGKSKDNNTVNTKQKTPVKIIEYLPGVWTIESVLKGKKDVTGTDTLAQNQIIEFSREAKYVSYNGNEKIDSGMYRINEDHGILYLSSQTTEKPSEWRVFFDPSGTMTLKRRDVSPQEESFSYVYRRNTNAASRR